MSRHIKLNNSSVSDYFKAAALEKGWIQEKVIEKKANKNVDISDNLDVNISTLILKLKEAGLSDLSNELNENFLYYKKASAGLYNVTKNEYNKLIHLSHPKGSVKLQNMSGDCVVEDLSATQKALMDLLKEKKRVKKANIFASEEDKKKADSVNLQLNSLKASLSSLLSKLNNEYTEEREELNNVINYISKFNLTAGWSSSNLKNSINSVVQDLSRLPNALKSLQIRSPKLFNHASNLIQNTINNINNNSDKIYSVENEYKKEQDLEYEQNRKNYINQIKKFINHEYSIFSLISRFKSLLNTFKEDDEVIEAKKYISSKEQEVYSLINTISNNKDIDPKEYKKEELEQMQADLTESIANWSNI